MVYGIEFLIWMQIVHVYFKKHTFLTYDVSFVMHVPYICLYIYIYIIYIFLGDDIHAWIMSDPHANVPTEWPFMDTNWIPSNLRYKCTLLRNKIVYHSDVVGASPVGTAPTKSSSSTEHTAIDCAKTTARQYEKHIVWGFSVTYIRCLTIFIIMHILYLYSLQYHTIDVPHALVRSQDSKVDVWNVTISGPFANMNHLESQNGLIN